MSLGFGGGPGDHQQGFAAGIPAGGAGRRELPGHNLCCSPEGEAKRAAQGGSEELNLGVLPTGMFQQGRAWDVWDVGSLQNNPKPALEQEGAAGSRTKQHWKGRRGPSLASFAMFLGNTFTRNALSCLGEVWST